MPTVKLAGGRQVATAALPDARKTAHESDLSTGAGLEDAKGRKWGQVAQLGQAVGQVAHVLGAEAIQMRAKAVDEANDVARLKWTNALHEWEQQTLYDPTAGALMLKGESALGVPEAVDASFTKLASDVAAGLSTDTQRLQFAKDKEQFGSSVAIQVRRHVATEMQTFRGNQLQARVVNGKNAAITNALDPRRVGIELATTIDDMKLHAPALGVPPEQVQQQIEALQNAVHVGVVERLLALDQTKKATAYFQEVKGDLTLTGEAIADLEHKLDTATTAQTGLSTAGKLWATLGPKSDVDPINLDTMETAAREQFADDPKALEATLHYLRERKAGVDAGRKEREDATSSAVWIKVSQGARLADVQRMPEFLALPGRAQAQVSNSIVDRAASRANQAYYEEGRAASREGREQTGKERKGWARYWELNDPTTLTRQSDAALNAMRGDLGDDHVNRLLTQKRALDKGEEAVRAATIDDDLFKTTAMSAGLDAYSPKTDAEKSDLGQLKNTVETAIDAEQRQTGKALTRDRKQTITREIVDTKVRLSEWGRDPTRVAALVSNADDRDRAYVPLADVPAVALAQYLNYARSLNPSTQRLPDAEIRTRFAERIQRAYARRVLGGTLAEIQAIIQGQE